jgi:Holliday junction resolvasome RuvABC DNA-binding subunit
MVELKSRLDLNDSTVGQGGDAVQSAAADVREALTALGYGVEEIRDAMRQMTSATDSEAMLRDALAMLGARRAG